MNLIAYKIVDTIFIRGDGSNAFGDYIPGSESSSSSSSRSSSSSSSSRSSTSSTSSTSSLSSISTGSSSSSSFSCPVSGIVVWDAYCSTVCNSIPYAVKTKTTAIATAKGWGTAIAVKGGQVYVWGSGNSEIAAGTDGNGGKNYVNPVKIDGEYLDGVVNIAGGYDHAIALNFSGKVIAWGNNNSGQCTVPQAAQTDVSAIAGGDYHTIALKNTEVLAWGRNSEGQCTVPEDAKGGVFHIAGGGYHTVAIKGGRVLAWGSNGYGQCNVPVDALNGVTAIAAGRYHTIALKAGEVLAWGSATNGHLNVPEDAKSEVIAISTALYNTVALKSDGTVVVWGSYNGVVTPTPTDLGVCTQIAAGDTFIMAINCTVDSSPSSSSSSLSSSSSTCWGITVWKDPDNLVYNLDNPPFGMQSIDQLFYSEGSIIALDISGKVWAWGRNQYGECNIPKNLGRCWRITAANGSVAAIPRTGQDKEIWQWGLNSANMCSGVLSGCETASSRRRLSKYTKQYKSDGSLDINPITGSKNAVPRNSRAGHYWVHGNRTNGYIAEPLPDPFLFNGYIIDDILHVTSLISYEVNNPTWPYDRPYTVIYKIDSSGFFSIQIPAWGEISADGQYGDQRQILPNTTIISQLTGEPGGTGTYKVKCEYFVLDQNTGGDGSGTIITQVKGGVNHSRTSPIPIVIRGTVSEDHTIFVEGQQNWGLKKPYNMFLGGGMFNTQINYIYLGSCRYKGVGTITLGRQQGMTWGFDGTCPNGLNYGNRSLPVEIAGQSTLCGEYGIVDWPSNLEYKHSSWFINNNGTVTTGGYCVPNYLCRIPERTQGDCKKIVVGPRHGAGINSNEELIVWGYIGNVPGKLGHVKDVWAGNDSIIALDFSGYLWCWGAYSFPTQIWHHLKTLTSVAYDKFDVPTTSAKPAYYKYDASNISIKDIIMGSEYAYPDRKNNVTIIIENNNCNYNSSSSTSTSSGDCSKIIAWGSNPNNETTIPSYMNYPGYVKKVSSSRSHNLIINQENLVEAWGLNDEGQCNIPGDLGPCKAIAAGRKHSAAIQIDGTVRVWGHNNNGQCNVPTTLGPCTDIAAGSVHTVCLTESGRIFAFGGEDKKNPYFYARNPASTTTLSGASGIPLWWNTTPYKCVGIAAGDYFTGVLFENGEWREWGISPSASDFNSRKYIGQNFPCTKIAGGGQVMMLCGKNKNNEYVIGGYGVVTIQCTYSYPYCHSLYIPPDITTEIKEISVGNVHVIALDVNDKIYAWGGTSGAGEIPNDIEDEPISQISAGDWHNLILTKCPLTSSSSSSSSITCSTPDNPIPKIHSIRFSESGIYVNQYIVLAGSPGTDLSPYHYITFGVDPYGGLVGDPLKERIDYVLDLNGYSIPSSGYFIIRGDSYNLDDSADIAGYDYVGPGTDTKSLFANLSNTTHLLVTEFTGSSDDYINESGLGDPSTGQGIIQNVYWSGIVDSVAISPTHVIPDGSYNSWYYSTNIVRINDPNFGFPQIIKRCINGKWFSDIYNGSTSANDIPRSCFICFDDR